MQNINFFRFNPLHLSVSLFLAAFALCKPTYATLPIPFDLAYGVGPSIARSLLSDASDYQIGAEWGKNPVTNTSIKQQSAAFKRAAFATVRIPRGGTGFYLGKFAGAHIIATNHHVCPTGASCLSDRAAFPLLGKSYKMSKFHETFKDIDLTLIEIQVPASDEANLAKIAKNFAFKSDLKHRQPLITIGFGVANNPLNALMGNQDSDCVVLSADGQYRHMKDPDDLNPGEDDVWSFANGCDVSHGDSGSAMVDRRTSAVMGIIWTGRIPKNPKVQNAEYMNQVQADPFHPDVWKEMSYAVPAIKMVQYILTAAQRETDVQTQTVLMNLLDQPSR